MAFICPYTGSVALGDAFTLNPFMNRASLSSAGQPPGGGAPVDMGEMVLYPGIPVEQGTLALIAQFRADLLESVVFQVSSVRGAPANRTSLAEQEEVLIQGIGEDFFEIAALRQNGLHFSWGNVSPFADERSGVYLLTIQYLSPGDTA